MTKVEVQTLTPSERQKILDELTNLLDALKNRQEAQQFVFTFLTSSEIVMVTRRVRVAHELLRGLSWRAVMKKHNIGLTTVRFVDRSLSKLLPAYRSSIPPLLRKPPAVLNRGLARIRKRSPLLTLLLQSLGK